MKNQNSRRWVVVTICIQVTRQWGVAGDGRGELGGLRCLFQSEVGTLVQVAVSKIRMVQVPRDEARRVTDFKVDRRVV